MKVLKFQHRVNLLWNFLYKTGSWSHRTPAGDKARRAKKSEKEETLWKMIWQKHFRWRWHLHLANNATRHLYLLALTRSRTRVKI